MTAPVQPGAFRYKGKKGQGSALDPLGPLPQTPTIKNRCWSGEAKKIPLFVGFGRT
jgi:hypothetical protein